MFNYNIGTKECSYFTTLEDTKGWVTGQADCKVIIVNKLSYWGPATIGLRMGHTMTNYSD